MDRHTFRLQIAKYTSCQGYISTIICCISTTALEDFSTISLSLLLPFNLCIGLHVERLDQHFWKFHQEYLVNP